MKNAFGILVTKTGGFSLHAVILIKANHSKSDRTTFLNYKLSQSWLISVKGVASGWVHLRENNLLPSQEMLWWEYNGTQKLWAKTATVKICAVL